MAMTTAAVKVLLEFLASLKVNTWLAAAALFALCCSLISGNLSTVAIFAIVAWISHFAAMSAIDIHRKGGEL
jgi:hypothetical protein